MSFFYTLKNKKSFLYPISIILSALTFMSQESHSYQSLITSNSKPTPILIELFQVLNFPAEDIQKMNAIAQQNFLRKAGEERWQMKEVSHEKEKVFPLLEKLGVMDEVFPSSEMYDSLDYIVIQGARVSTMQDRVNFLITYVWPKLSDTTKKRVKVVFLSGDRKLDVSTHEKEDLFALENPQLPFRSGKTNLSYLPTTESDAARVIWDQMVFDERLHSKILFVDAPQPKEGQRPTTKDTIEMWLNSFKAFQKDPNSVPPEYRLFWQKAKDLNTSKILSISTNPFIPYQDMVFRNTLRKKGFKNISLETVGSRSDPHIPLAIHLDNLARWIYETSESLKTSLKNKK